MTEVVKPAEGTEKVETVVTQTEQEAPQVSELEQRALDMGWRPKEEFNGNEDDFIDAKEFVRRQPLFDKIETSTKEVKALRKAFEALKGHYTKVQETEYNRALSALQEAREEAITNADGASFTKLDKEIKKVEAQMAEVQKPLEVPPEVPQEFTNWTNKNQWYTNTSYMRKWADDYGTDLAKQGMSPADVLRKVEEGVRKEFPHKFTNPNKANAPSVENGKPGSTQRSQVDKFELTEQERTVMNTLIRSDPKTFTKEKYIAELKAAKGIK